MPHYAAAIEQGTTGTRFMVFDRQGAVVAATYEEHAQITPQSGWGELCLCVVTWEISRRPCSV